MDVGGVGRSAGQDADGSAAGGFGALADGFHNAGKAAADGGHTPAGQFGAHLLGQGVDVGRRVAVANYCDNHRGLLLRKGSLRYPRAGAGKTGPG